MGLEPARPVTWIQAAALAEAFGWRWARKTLLEVGVPVVRKPWVLAVIGGAMALLVLVAAAVGWFLGDMSPEASALAAVLLLVAALFAPWFLGSLGARRLADVSVDPTHALVRPALRSAGVLMVARLVVPSAVSVLIAEVALLIVVAAAGWLSWGTGALVVGAVFLHAVAVLVLRVSVMAIRTWGIAWLRRGRSGLIGRGLGALTQVLLAYAAPHLLVAAGEGRSRPSPDLLLATGREWITAPRGLVTLLLLSAVVLLVVGMLPRLLGVAVRALDVEFGQASARLGGARPLLLDRSTTPRRAMLRVSWGRVRRGGGVLIGSAVSSVTFGVVLAAFGLGAVSSGLLHSGVGAAEGVGAATVDVLSLSVIVLLAVEMASVGVVRLTSPDADRSAMDLIARIPGAYDAGVHAKSILHGLLVATPLLGLLTLVAVSPADWVMPRLSAAVLVFGVVVLSVVEHVGAPALYPRRDWTELEQIGRHPRAQAWGLGLNVVAMVILVPVTAMVQRVADPSVPVGWLSSVCLVALAVAAGTMVAPRVTVALVRSWA